MTIGDEVDKLYVRMQRTMRRIAKRKIDILLTVELIHAARQSRNSRFNTIILNETD